MSDLLDRAVAELRTLPQETQDEAARLLLDWAGDLAPSIDDRAPVPIESSHRAAVQEGLSDLRARRIATKGEIEAAFARFR